MNIPFRQYFDMDFPLDDFHILCRWRDRRRRRLATGVDDGGNGRIQRRGAVRRYCPRRYDNGETAMEENLQHKL